MGRGRNYAPLRFFERVLQPARFTYPLRPNCEQAYRNRRTLTEHAESRAKSGNMQ